MQEEAQHQPFLSTYQSESNHCSVFTLSNSKHLQKIHQKALPIRSQMTIQIPAFNLKRLQVILQKIADVKFQ